MAFLVPPGLAGTHHLRCAYQTMKQSILLFQTKVNEDQVSIKVDPSNKFLDIQVSFPKWSSALEGTYGVDFVKKSRKCLTCFLEGMFAVFVELSKFFLFFKVLY